MYHICPFPNWEQIIAFPFLFVTYSCDRSRLTGGVFFGNLHLCEYIFSIHNLSCSLPSSIYICLIYSYMLWTHESSSENEKCKTHFASWDSCISCIVDSIAICKIKSSILICKQTAEFSQANRSLFIDSFPESAYFQSGFDFFFAVQDIAFHSIFRLRILLCLASLVATAWINEI